MSTYQAPRIIHCKPQKINTMKNYIKILFALLSFSLFTASCTGGMLGGTPGQQSSTPDGQYMFITGYAFGVAQPAQYYVYLPVDPNDEKKSLRPKGEQWTVNVWPSNANAFGLLFGTINNNPWPAFSVNFAFDTDGIAAMTAMQASWDAAYANKLTVAMCTGYVKPYKDATDSNQPVKLRATAGSWIPLWH